VDGVNENESQGRMKENEMRNKWDGEKVEKKTRMVLQTLSVT
jgi:hypothetical protein